MKMLLYLPMVVYVPVLTFRQVTGINSDFPTAMACLICIFYTTVGGLKAVVWTNTIQMGATVTGILAVLIIGIKEVGISNVIKRNKDTDRFEFINLDPSKRDTVWSIIIGNYFYLLANCTVNQSLVQRYLAVPNRKKGNLSVLNFAIGTTFIVSTCCITGLVIFAYYYECDPWNLQEIRRVDEILPYFVREVGSVVPGLPVLFVSGLFSTTLSVMSSALNSVTGVIFEDLVRPSTDSFSEKKTCILMKIIVLIVGILCVVMAFIVDNLNTLIQAARISDITTGPLLGMFTLGMFFPWANAKGAFFGGISGTAVSLLLSIVSQAAIAHDRIQYPQKPLSISRCPPPTLSDYDYFFSPKEVPYDFNFMKEPHWIFEIAKISYWWHTLIGAVTVLFFGISASYLSGFTDPKLVNKDLITPVLHRFLPETKENDEIPQQVEEEI
ncbi:sodium-coupled monocarboxylate transporter 1-like isoform X2 [Rhodnius prolixus]